jgi:crotonobetainyl-CoA:carnitine CoA-transferase CaiB-like acyl-CoA transferase
LHQSVHNSPPPRTGNDHADFAPHGVYPCKGDDQWILIQVMSEAQWQALQNLCTELNQFSDITDRLERRSALNKTLAQWTANQQSSELMAQLQSLGITAATLNNGLSLLEDEQHKARGYMQWLDRAFVGKQPHPSLPFRNGSDPSPLNTPAPTLGQHNKEVLGGILGLNDAELEKLALEAVIGDKPKLET